MPDSVVDAAGETYDGTPIHQMEDGLVVMQAETGVFQFEGEAANDLWELTTQFDDDNGSGVMLWTGGDMFNGSNAGQTQSAPMSYSFTVDEPGTYFISLRAIRPVTGEESDRNNDFFVRFEDEDWTKLFFSGQRETFVFGTTYDSNHNFSQASFEVTEEMIAANDGVFTLEIGARSRYAGLDQIHIQKDNANRDQDAETSEVVVSEDVDGSILVAMDDSATVNEDGSVTIDVLNNDSTTGDGGLTITDVSNPEDGSVEISGSTVVYTPDGGFFGDDVFTYTVTDNSGATATAEVSIVVQENEEERSPMARGDGPGLLSRLNEIFGDPADAENDVAAMTSSETDIPDIFDEADDAQAMMRSEAATSDTMLAAVLDFGIDQNQSDALL